MTLVDLLGRPLRSLRVSVTDRCNLRCQYCMPEAEYAWLPREDLLTFEEIGRLVDVFASCGVDKVRLTGGEPLLRRDLQELVRLLAADSRITDLALTTNGVLLAAQAEALRAAGLMRVTVSLDTLRPERFTALTTADHARPRARGDRRRRARVSVAQARLRRDARRQRRRTGAACRVRAGAARRGPVHRIHGRRRRHPLVGRQGGVPRRDPRSGSRRTTARWSRLARPPGRRPTATAWRTARPSASSPRPRRPSAPPATGPASPPTACGSPASTRRAASTSAARSAPAKPPDEIAARIEEAWRARSDRGAELRAAERERGVYIPAAALKGDVHLEMHTRGG